MKVILISGKAGSGKNEVSNLLKNKLHKCIVTSLAKYIKIYAVEYGIYDWNENNKPRTFLQTMGDFLRTIDINFLNNRVLDDIKVYSKDFNYVIISDIRLLSEINFFKNKIENLVLIRVNSNVERRKLLETELNHKTEIDLDNYNGFDYIIENNDNNLEEKILKIVEEIK